MARSEREQGSAQVNDPIPLTTAQAIDPVAWACGSCRAIFGHEADARAHCRCERCSVPIAARERSGRLCPSCAPIARAEQRAESDARMAERDAAAFAKARKVPEEKWTSAVVWEDGSGDMSGDGYFSSPEAVRDSCAANDVPVPAYVWGTAEEGMGLDAGSIVESALEDTYDGARDQLSAEAEVELQDLLDAWCERHPVKWYREDRSVAVMMTGREENIK